MPFRIRPPLVLARLLPERRPAQSPRSPPAFPHPACARTPPSRQQGLQRPQPPRATAASESKHPSITTARSPRPGTSASRTRSARIASPGTSTSTGFYDRAASPHRSHRRHCPNDHAAPTVRLSAHRSGSATPCCGALVVRIEKTAADWSRTPPRQIRFIATVSDEGAGGCSHPPGLVDAPHRRPAPVRVVCLAKKVRPATSGIFVHHTTIARKRIARTSGQRPRRLNPQPTSISPRLRSISSSSSTVMLCG